MQKVSDGSLIVFPKTTKRIKMSHKLLQNASFYELLIKIDMELAAVTKQNGCPNCGEKLDVANYPRRPLGIHIQHRHFYEIRFSFCCRVCRARTTVYSVRFFGRRRYPTPILLLLSLFRGKITERRLEQIERIFGIYISEKTLKRWRRWWRKCFFATNFWKEKQGLFAFFLPPEHLPLNMFKQFKGKLQDKMVLILKFLAPMTAGILRAV